MIVDHTVYQRLRGTLVVFLVLKQLSQTIIGRRRESHPTAGRRMRDLYIDGALSDCRSSSQSA
ncbi:hypothetical protein BST27_04770 [Mycobacterium intermedium]|uniref:Uncharacterized protein n=1 Tax=Mycobacterium intermedium TaxID=28445 RepID=A0A1E3SMG4_MYCIE|nr:hypothetical protein BHQ20_00095 [Mycobacterium intermedium]OPE47214.1 hypothetical protein BV508_22975 [Mycobacterium intermedium]ORB09671.1 hypothetical protein BST27_04770 [Mycobacterium intermedium]